MTLTELSIKRPAALVMFFLAVAVFGLISYQKLPVDLLPSMDWPWVTVVTTWPGAGPKEVETMITKPLEDAVISLNKLKHVRSFSRENVSVVLLEFDMSANADAVLQETQRVINTVRAQLPDDAKEPQLYKSDLGAIPVIRLAVSSNLPGSELFTLVDQKVKPRLEQIDGVGQIQLSGTEEREIQIAVDPDRLRTHGLSLSDINKVLNAENLDVPAGKITSTSQDFIVRYSGKFVTLDEIERTRIPLASGGAIFLRDIAAVSDTIKSDRTLTRVNSGKALGIQIVKQSQANSVQTAERVRQELKKLEKEYAGTIKFEIAQDITIFTKNAVNEVKRNVLEALIVVALVLLIFLHSLRNSLIVLVAIPLSLVTTFITMSVFGFSINLMTMMSLGMVIGVLVDDSIVVLENIHRWLKKGADPVTAAIKGRNEIGLAAVSITMVDVVVFLPVAFLEGLVGNIFREFSLVFVSAVLMSLLVSFTVTPWLASRLNSEANIEGEKWMRGFARRFEKWFHNLENRYRNILRWSLDHRFRIVLLVTGLFALSIALVPLGYIGFDFFAATDRGEFAVFTKMPLGTPLEENDKVIAQIENYIQTIPDVEQLMVTIGQQEREFGLTNDPRLCGMQVRLVDRRVRQRSTTEIQNEIARYISQLPGMDVAINDIGIFGTANSSPIQYEIRGQDLDSVQVAVAHAQALLRTIPGARDVQSSYDLGAPELQVIVDREKVAASYLTPGEVAVALRAAVNGEIVSRFRTGEIEIDIRSMYAPHYRNNPALLGQLEIRNHIGQMVKLSEVSRIDRTSGPSSIQRKDRERLVTINANVAGRTLSEVQGAFDKEMAKFTPPKGVSFYAFGDVENMNTMMTDMMMAIMLSILFVYMILVALYESYIHPFTVMFSLPMALIGALFALAISGKSLAMFTMIGILILMGLVAKNGILLVDFTNQLRSQGMKMREALLTAGPLRLRPILMTTSTMVVGMIPLAFALGEGADMRSGMGIVIIGGLISSLLLTLVLVPVMYTFLDRFSRKYKEESTTEALR
ncbi:MAG: efflux RND transporter permease subunit [bacterium]|nr:efflux RND transporter permease subunit [bacterium]